MQLAQSDAVITTVADAGGAVGTTTYYPPDTTATNTSTMDTASADAVTTSTDPFGNIDVTKLIDSLAKSYVAVQTAINAGHLPTTTANHPAPGTVQHLPNGVTKVVNADGSTTITDAHGNQQTVTKSGQVVAGGAPLIDGIPNGTLLLAGIALLGIVLKAR